MNFDAARQGHRARAKRGARADAQGARVHRHAAETVGILVAIVGGAELLAEQWIAEFQFSGSVFDERAGENGRAADRCWRHP